MDVATGRALAVTTQLQELMKTDLALEHVSCTPTFLAVIPSGHTLISLLILCRYPRDTQRPSNQDAYSAEKRQETRRSVPHAQGASGAHALDMGH
jgi:hypothetical protein